MTCPNYSASQDQATDQAVWLQTRTLKQQGTLTELQKSRENKIERFLNKHPLETIQPKSLTQRVKTHSEWVAQTELDTYVQLQLQSVWQIYCLQNMEKFDTSEVDQHGFHLKEEMDLEEEKLAK